VVDVWYVKCWLCEGVKEGYKTEDKRERLQYRDQAAASPNAMRDTQS
jgi:hypothetical protein